MKLNITSKTSRLDIGMAGRFLDALTITWRKGCVPPVEITYEGSTFDENTGASTPTKVTVTEDGKTAEIVVDHVIISFDGRNYDDWEDVIRAVFRKLRSET